VTPERILAELDRLIGAAAPSERPALALALTARLATLAAAGLVEHTTTTTATVDMNISVEEAARSLGVSPSWLYKNRGELPFVGRIGRRVVCSAAGVERYRRRRLNGTP
jgi:hypothetical protein